MEKKVLQLKTKRLRIIPMSDEEMEQMIAETNDEELKQAYQKMLDGCLKDAGNRLWYTAWKICLKENMQLVGTAGFKGPAESYSVEIGYGITEEYEGNGYAVEAAKALIEWAFAQENVFFVEAETAPDNTASMKVLEKLSFKPDRTGKEGPRFVLEKSEMLWMPIYMCFGLSIGISLGTAANNMTMGMCLGMAIGLCIGSALDMTLQKKRTRIRAEREQKIK